MKKLAVMLLTFCVSLWVVSTALATPTITFESAGTLFTSKAGADQLTFDYLSPPVPAGSPFSLSGDYRLVSGSVSGSAWPPNTAPYYLSVPTESQGSGTAKLTLSYKSNYFGMYWGSMDTYNHIDFLNDDTSVFTYGGSQALTALGGSTGNQTSVNSNRYINFDFTDASFNKVLFNTTSKAFEVDNIAAHAVPEPATMVFLGLGLLGFAGARRRFKK